MAMHSKPVGAYAQESQEWIDNARVIYAFIRGWMTHEASCAVIGNMDGESGLNPWRWQGDNIRSRSQKTYPRIGYGLVQYTPAEKYFNGAGTWNTANFSDKSGSSNDYQHQLDFFFSSIKSQWNTTTGSRKSWSEFCATTDIDTATYDFLYQFEQPADPAGTLAARQSAAHKVAIAVYEKPDFEYIWPLPGYNTITTYFGQPDAIYGQPHRGMDIAAPYMTPILACNGGVVVRATYDSSWGNFIEIDHLTGIHTLYAHMAQPSQLRPGDVVQQGDVIGFVGSTGDSTGNHLHIEFSKNGSFAYENLVDPRDYIFPTNYPPEPHPNPPSTASKLAPIINELRRRKILL